MACSAGVMWPAAMAHWCTYDIGHDDDDDDDDEHVVRLKCWKIFKLIENPTLPPEEPPTQQYRTYINQTVAIRNFVNKIRNKHTHTHALIILVVFFYKVTGD